MLCTTHESDWDILSRHLQGDRRAFGDLVKRHTPAMRHHFSKFLDRLESSERKDVVDDLMQELWWRLYRHAERLDMRRKFTAWLYTVATNLAINAQRDARRHKMERWPSHVDPDTGEVEDVEFADPRPESRPDIVCEQRDLRAFMTQQLAESFSPAQLEILQAHNRGRRGHKYDDISQRLGIPVGTVKSRLHRVRKALRQIRHENDGGDTN